MVDVYVAEDPSEISIGVSLAENVPQSILDVVNFLVV
jgi:hypothetical protein